jgi:hypothetical protein
MRTGLIHRHVPHHETSWWLSHGVTALIAVVVAVYLAAVLLVVAGGQLFS